MSRREGQSSREGPVYIHSMMGYATPLLQGALGQTERVTPLTLLLMPALIFRRDVIFRYEAAISQP